MSAYQAACVPPSRVLPSVAAGANRRVLFACYDESWPASALLRAHQFAERLRDELYVLRVCPSPRTAWHIPRRRRPLAALRSIEALEKSRAELLQRCGAIVWPALPEPQILSAEGDPIEVTARIATELGAELIVLPPQPRPCGDAAMQIVQAARVPVLVARPGRSHNIVVAATNLKDQRYPVLRHARSISALLQADLLLVHNVEPALIAPTPEVAMLWLQTAPPAEKESQAHTLDAVAKRIPRCTGSIIRSEANTAQAILDTSRSCDADLIVVGVARVYSRWERLLGKSVAARVAERAYRSVLLFPISPPSSEAIPETSA